MRPVHAMSRGRVWMVHALVASLLGLTTIAFLRREPLWPISHYPMFSYGKARADATAFEVYVVAAGDESLLPRERGTFFRDFDGESVRTVAAHIAAADGPGSEQSRRFLAMLLGALQREAGSRSEDVPEAVRLYRVVWRYPSPSDPIRHVAQRTLLAEARAGDAR